MANNSYVPGPRFGETVFVRTLDKKGRVTNIEYDDTWGLQIQVSVIDESYPTKDNPVVDYYWVTLNDIEKIDVGFKKTSSGKSLYA